MLYACMIKLDNKKKCVLEVIRKYVFDIVSCNDLSDFYLFFLSLCGESVITWGVGTM